MNAPDDDEVVVVAARITPKRKLLHSSAASRSKKKAKVIDLTLDSDDDDVLPLGTVENRTPLKRKKKRGPTSDEELARQLAAEEEQQFQVLAKAVEARREGIVFRLSVDVETKLLDDGTPAHEDDLARFEPWRAILANSGVKVKKFHWVVNYELEKRFEAAREILRRNMDGKEPEERRMFHGTRPENIDKILEGGFKIGGIGGHGIVNGHLQGYGVYLAENFALSLGHAANSTRIFACRVLPGRTTNSETYTQSIPSKAVCSGQYESYSGTPGMLVVRHTALVLPCYMIEFEMQNNYYDPYYGLLPLYAPPAVPLFGGGLGPYAPFGAGAPALGGLAGDDSDDDF
ncbi:PARP catalytic domain-containing protein [Mycena kentingensis (nom. inval.)]|nr:PARP catalytic domain-containing protein [Mycena kentingensis (nom. inval.)]